MDYRVLVSPTNVIWGECDTSGMYLTLVNWKIILALRSLVGSKHGLMLVGLHNLVQTGKHQRIRL